MLRRILRVALLASLLLVALLATGCGGEQTSEIPNWTLQIGEGGPRSQISLPLHVDGQLPDEPSTFTLRTTTALPPEFQGHDLCLTIPHLAAKVTLLVGGRPAVTFDEESTSGYRARGPHGWRIPRAITNAKTLDLELTVANTWARSGWLDSVPRLSATEDGDAEFRWVKRVNEIGGTVALGTLLPFGLLHAVLFVFDRRRTRNAWFAMLAITASMYPAFTLGYTQYIFGTFEGRLLVVANTAAVISGFCFTRTLFDLGPPPRLYGVLLAIVVLAALVAPGPFAPHFLGLVGGAASITTAAHHTITNGLLFRKKRRWNNRLLVPAWAIATAVGIVDARSVLGLGESLGGVRAVCWGLALIGLLQSVALSRNFIVSVNRTERLNLELAERVALLEARQTEIQHLNDELRHQIAGRSRQISVAFTRLASGTGEITELLAGDIIEQRYRVIRLVGVGGMGSVYEVVRVADGRRLALKVLTKMSGGIEVARFAREAQIASSVNHPNVIGVVDVDIATSGYVYLVMEFMDGVSLAQRRALFGDVPWGLGILHQIAEGLAALHAKGIVHRDLKPGNVLLVEDDSRAIPLAKISDFGISSLAETAATGGDPSDADATLRLASHEQSMVLPALDSSDTPLTGTGVIMGTPVYMAPELAFGAKSAQPASDVFSLGVIAFELLTGRRPFVEPLAVAVLRGKDVPDPDPIGTLVPSLDPAVAALIDRALDLEPEVRGTARELADALRERVALRA